jgi:hypothetical protein
MVGVVVAAAVTVQRERLLKPENQTTKSPRHEETKGNVSFFFVSLRLRGSFLFSRYGRSPISDYAEIPTPP